MFIIDSHAHIFPDAIAQKASDSIGAFYDHPMRHDGTLSTLLRLSDETGIARCVVHSVAMVPSRVPRINDFLAGQVRAHADRLIGFACMHPDYEHIPEEVERICSMGLTGIKIHPDMQRFALDEPRTLRMFEAIEGRLIVMTHAGDVRYAYSRPQQSLRVHKLFPRMKLICAHFGGWTEWEDASRQLADCEDIYVDTSSSLFALDPKRAVEIIRRFNPEHVLFGTDYPMWGAPDEMERFNRLDLTEPERRRILGENAQRLFAR